MRLPAMPNPSPKAHITSRTSKRVHSISHLKNRRRVEGFPSITFETVIHLLLQMRFTAEMNGILIQLARRPTLARKPQGMYLKSKSTTTIPVRPQGRSPCGLAAERRMGVYVLYHQISSLSIGLIAGHCDRRVTETKKPTWLNTHRCSTTSVYSSTSSPAKPGCSSSSHPTTSFEAKTF